MLRRASFLAAGRATQLKNMLTSNTTEMIMEAHSGLSAKIVEEAGFKGIWGSGLSISAQTGVRDNNELSYTQVLDIIEYMSDASSLPLLLDGDTGYGNFNNARRLVQKLEQRNVAGVCIEDKLFPKTNSLLSNVRQPLADVEEFCGKIKAMKDTQQDPDFCVVARVEAFIAGWPLEEALRRAEAYAAAGADAVLIHSKKKTPEDIEAFMAAWKNQCPVVIVPTAYPDVPYERFQEMGISLIIWANHTLRSSIAGMQDITKQIQEKRSLSGIDAQVAPVAEVFRLQNQQEYLDAEAKYLPKTD